MDSTGVNGPDRHGSRRPTSVRHSGRAAVVIVDGVGGPRGGGRIERRGRGLPCVWLMVVDCEPAQRRAVEVAAQQGWHLMRACAVWFEKAVTWRGRTRSCDGWTRRGHVTRWRLRPTRGR
eukprot:1980300-Prymnesium_polylepis.1